MFAGLDSLFMWIDNNDVSLGWVTPWRGQANPAYAVSSLHNIVKKGADN